MKKIVIILLLLLLPIFVFSSENKFIKKISYRIIQNDDVFTIIELYCVNGYMVMVVKGVGSQSLEVKQLRNSFDKPLTCD